MRRENSLFDQDVQRSNKKMHKKIHAHIPSEYTAILKIFKVDSKACFFLRYGSGFKDEVIIIMFFFSNFKKLFSFIFKTLIKNDIFIVALLKFLLFFVIHD
ncbi:hypothetical protein CDIK_4161 [Cucumispora dikerogammari]|nr:hypothetical protein CDIK_4161 [Cucumispora dikerogammari]